jgi:SAM-dependent methyltransferase
VSPFESDDNEILTALLSCETRHHFPVIGGIPRMLPSSMSDHWTKFRESVTDALPTELDEFAKEMAATVASENYDVRTKANFSNEWENHEIGGDTWGMKLDDRIQWYFLDSIRIPVEELPDLLLLDAGCGNGSQSVGYTKLGLEVIALDLSTGLEKGYAFRNFYSGAVPENVHFVQADLQKPPLARGVFDIIHSAGVLHHTPNTEDTFRLLAPLLKKGGTFFVWLYKYEKFVTPLVNSIRTITTRVPAPIFARIADLTAVPFIGFCWAVNKLGIRSYRTPNKKEAAIAVHDIFGAPYAHYHEFDEVAEWFRSEGIEHFWACNDGRRGFGVCGRKAGGTGDGREPIDIGAITN